MSASDENSVSEPITPVRVVTRSKNETSPRKASSPAKQRVPVDDESSSEEEVPVKSPVIKQAAKPKKPAPPEEDPEEDVQPSKVEPESSSEDEAPAQLGLTPIKKPITPAKRETSPAKEEAPAAKEEEEEGEADEEEGEKKEGYKELWEKGQDLGLIEKELAPMRHFNRFMPKKQLLDYLERYEAAAKADQKEIASAFKSEFEKVKAEKKASRKKGGTHKKGGENKKEAEKKPTNKKATANKQGESNSKKASNKKASNKKNETGETKNSRGEGKPKRGTHKKSSFKKGGSQKRDGQREHQRSPLMALWDEAVTKGLLSDEDIFHRRISSFITPSELNSLLQSYTQASEKKKAGLAKALKEDLDAFNEETPRVERFYKVYRGYKEIWDECVTARLISKEIEFLPTYAEWLSLKVLVGYLQTIASFETADERKSFRTIVNPLIAVKLEAADVQLKYRAKLAAMSTQALMAECVKKGLISKKNSCATNPECVASVDKEDMAVALGAFLSASEAEGDRRRARWEAHLARVVAG